LYNVICIDTKIPKFRAFVILNKTKVGLNKTKVGLNKTKVGFKIKQKWG
jgi:hypothetical protein